MVSSTLCFELAEASPSTSRVVLHDSSKNIQYASRNIDMAMPPPPNPPHPINRHGANVLNNTLTSRQVPLKLQHEHPTNASNKDMPTEFVGQNLLGNIQNLAIKVGSCMHPQGTSFNDDSFSQRAINVATSLPFLALGYSLLKRTSTSEGRQYAHSMLAVGTAATLYHASAGPFRRIARKIDYWTIAVSSTYMIKATVAPQNQLARTALHASLLAIPFKPLTISTMYTLAMQADYARQALAHKSMRPHFNRHVLASAASGVAFALEDYIADRGFGHVHGIWHLLAAAGVASVNPLIEHKERLRTNRNGDSGSGLKKFTSALTSCHDSVLSLDSMSPSSPSSTGSGTVP